MYYQQLPLYLKLTILLKLLYQLVHELPKEYKFSLGTDILERNWRLIDLFIEAQTLSMVTEHNQTKGEIITRLSLKFDQFRLRIRFLGELRLISLGQSAMLNDRLEEIGKMIGSWNKKKSSFIQRSK